MKECVHSVLNDEILELEKTTILHKLSQCPLNDDQMTTIMDIIKTGQINPSAKDANGHTFLELSPIVDKLSRRIYIANDSWIKNLWRVWKMKKWIKLRNDRLLLDIFKRMSILMSSSSFQNSEIRDPLRLARAMWREKTNFPEAFEEFTSLTAMYHDNDKSKLKRMCKKYLSSGTLDIALPFFKELCIYTLDKPKVG